MAEPATAHAEPAPDPQRWLTTPEIAAILNISTHTVQEVCRNPERAKKEWGYDAEGNPNWRTRPLAIRKIFEVRAGAVMARLYG